jgi:hypothetical protein
VVETRGEDRQRLPHRWPARQEALGMAGSTHCAELPARGEPMAGSQLWTGSVSAMTDCTRSRHAGWCQALCAQQRAAPECACVPACGGTVAPEAGLRHSRRLLVAWRSWTPRARETCGCADCTPRRRGSRRCPGRQAPARATSSPHPGATCLAPWCAGLPSASGSRPSRTPTRSVSWLCVRGGLPVARAGVRCTNSDRAGTGRGRVHSVPTSTSLYRL